jgi:hypothetical protein
MDEKGLDKLVKSQAAESLTLLEVLNVTLTMVNSLKLLCT